MDKLDFVLAVLGIVLTGSLFTPAYTFIVYELESTSNNHYILTIQTRGLQGVSDVDIAISNVTGSNVIIHDASDQLLKNLIIHSSYPNDVQIFQIKRMLTNEKIVFDITTMKSTKIVEDGITVKSNEVKGITTGLWYSYLGLFFTSIPSFLFFYLYRRGTVKPLKEETAVKLAKKFHEKNNHDFKDVYYKQSLSNCWEIEIRSTDNKIHPYVVYNDKRVVIRKGLRRVF